VLAADADDAVGALDHLAEIVGAAPDAATTQPAQRPESPNGALTGESLALAIAAHLPDGAIVSDESNTSGVWVGAATTGAARHDWLTLTGGAIGQGLPVATGAAIACPDRKVVCLEADGSALYTIQSLWTQAREQLDVTTVILDNRSYAILNLELARVGAEPGPRALSMLDLSRPGLDFVALAKGMGVDASRATTAEELAKHFARAMVEPGPHLIDAVVPSIF
jgi:acetolactate synthase I/II/III large subunit